MGGKMSLKSFLFKVKMNLWAPLFGAGIRVTNVADDMSSFDMEMKLHWWNKNREGIHFGGSLFAMADPTFGAILASNLGNDYFIVDKYSTIKFLRPGKGKVTAHFNIAAERIKEIKKEADENYKAEPHFTAQIRDEQGTLVAEVEKTVYVRRRDRKPTPGFKKPQG
jgi:acyl-coenzyme A thioesterase PaaI-like protein